MKIDLDITWDDLSEECKSKIKKLQKLMGKDNVNITYPNVDKYVNTPDWTKQISTPSPGYPSQWPIDRFPEITCQSTNAMITIDNHTQQYDLVCSTKSV